MRKTSYLPHSTQPTPICNIFSLYSCSEKGELPAWFYAAHTYPSITVYFSLYSCSEKGELPAWFYAAHTYPSITVYFSLYSCSEKGELPAWFYAAHPNPHHLGGVWHLLDKPPLSSHGGLKPSGYQVSEVYFYTPKKIIEILDWGEGDCSCLIGL